ncbi:MAG: FkbM family methyltransferase [Flavobacterium sp.]|nr:FkbM family methyltransferase [Flavobacterium sp.]
MLDIGANIGLSILFFKELYPKAELIAFEADPKIFGYLENNVHGNGYEDVTLINKAVWYENTTLNFAPDGADGGQISINENTNIIVETVDIADLLKHYKFDL